MPKDLSPEKRKKADRIAVKILEHSRNMLIMDLRFLEKAVGILSFVPYSGSICVNGEYLYYDSRYILTSFRLNEKSIARSCLHMILHCVFRHFAVSPSIDRKYWDLASDIAVEVMLGELGYTDPDNMRAAKQSLEIADLKKQLNYLTAEKIFDLLQTNPPAPKRLEALSELFAEDEHSLWYKPGRKPNKNAMHGSDDSSDNEDDDEPDYSYAFYDDDKYKNRNNDSDEEGSQGSLPNKLRGLNDDEDIEELWKNISKRMQTDLETISKLRANKAGNLVQNLQALNREKYDYAEFLRKFAVYGEEMKTDEDSFDYNFYCYGLEEYGNAAIIEPLEYKDVKKVREFVIAIDTSGSVRGETVQRFLQKTFNILMQRENFFTKVNIHIIQCDASVQEDAKLTSPEEFEEYIKTMELRGFGGTDFRPVFRYVDKMIENREFENLRGLIYFTDGNGFFPEKQPPYNTAFVFVDNDYNNYNVPVWAMKLILETDDIDKY